MTKSGERLIASLEEALKIAKGEEPAARLTINGHTYVPEERLTQVYRTGQGRMCDRVVEIIRSRHDKHMTDAGYYRDADGRWALAELKALGIDVASHNASVHAANACHSLAAAIAKLEIEEIRP